MRLRKPLPGILTLLALAVIATGCLNLSGPKSADVTGTVKYVDGTPIANATVKLGSLTTTTNASGAFSFKAVPNGTYTLTVTVEGEQVHSRQVSVSGKPVSIAVQVLLDECWAGPNPPAGMTMVLCIDGRGGDTVQDLGFTVSGGTWKIVQDGGRHWIEVLGDAIRWASIEVPELATAQKVAVEFTGKYVSAGNTWGLVVLDDDPSKAHNNAFMILSAYNGVYLRPYNDGSIKKTYIAAPKVEQNEEVTIRLVYDRTTQSVSMYRNGSLVTFDSAVPVPLPDDHRFDGPEHTWLKLYANVGGSAGPTTARFTDIRVWVS